MQGCGAPSAQGGSPRPSSAWAGDEARTRLPAYTLVELGYRLGLDDGMTAVSHQRTFGRLSLNVRFGIESGHSVPGFAFVETETFPRSRKDFLTVSLWAEEKLPMTLL